MTHSKIEIERRLGLEVTTFAFPFGDTGSCGMREFELAKNAGFNLAFTTRNRWIGGMGLDVRWQLPRLNISGSWDSLNSLLFRVNGWSMIQERKKSRLKNGAEV